MLTGVETIIVDDHRLAMGKLVAGRLSGQEIHALRLQAVKIRAAIDALLAEIQPKPIDLPSLRKAGL